MKNINEEYKFENLVYEVSQRQRVFDAIVKKPIQMKRNKYLRDGEWKSLDDLYLLTGDPIKSIGARLRELRKNRFGKHNVEHMFFKRNGIHYYRLSV
jgi:hypothetical protein